MNEKTLTALKGSIDRWEGRAAGNFLAPTISNCPLCDLFYGRGCEGCPVMEKTGDDCCTGTPCEEYADMAGWGSTPKPDASKDSKLAYIASREVAFLKSLLPHASEESEHG